MSYANPSILFIDTPSGLDHAIESLREDLSTIIWMEKSFGRAWEFTEYPEDQKSRRIPKIYLEEGEYHNVLPNDFLKSQSFIAARGEERWTEYTNASRNPKERDLSVIIWVNLNEIDPNEDHVFTDKLKKDVEKILKRNQYVKSINGYWDERASDVFAGYDLPEKSEYLMHPYAGMRFNITVGYWEEC